MQNEKVKLSYSKWVNFNKGKTFIEKLHLNE